MPMTRPQKLLASSFPPKWLVTRVTFSVVWLAFNQVGHNCMLAHPESDYGNLGEDALKSPIYHTDHRVDKESSGSHAEALDINREILNMAKARNLKAVTNLLPKMSDYLLDDGGTEGTLAHYAAYNNWLPLLKHLIQEKRVPADAKNHWDNRSPFLSACCGGSLEVVKYYLEDLSYPKWKEGNENGMTCAHFAAREDHHRLLSYIIQLWKQGANETTQTGPLLPPDVEDWLPLHYAANNGHKEATIVLMLDAKADPYRKNREGKSALDISRERGDKELIDIMLDPIKFKILTIVEDAMNPLKQAQEILRPSHSLVHQSMPSYDMRTSRDTSSVSHQVAELNATFAMAEKALRDEVEKLKEELPVRFEEVRVALSNQAHGIKSLQEAASQKLQELAQFVKMKTKLVASSNEIKHKSLESDFLAFREQVERELLGMKNRMDSVGSTLAYSAGQLKRETEKESHNLEVVKREFPRLWGHLDQLRRDLKKLEEKFPSMISV